MGCLDRWHSLYAQIPTNPEGSIETGSIETQTELTFGNLAKMLQTGGASSRMSHRFSST
jgi:Putative translation initiation inhibitor, yjgF family